MKRIVIAVLGLSALGVFVARMSNSVHALAQSTAWTQTITNQYGTYTASSVASYDPDAGSGNGVLYVTEQLTGRPSNFMPGGVLHTPSATVHMNGTCDGVPNCKQTANGVPANQSPNFSRTWSFDILADCDLQLLDYGFCTGDGNINDFCPIAAIYFANFFHGMEYENAITDFFVHSGQQGMLNTACTPESSPPDFPGPFNAPDISDIDRTFRAQTGCYRFCNSPPCKGILWTCAGKIKQSKQIPNTPLLNCTNKDKGFITGQNVTY